MQFETFVPKKKFDALTSRLEFYFKSSSAVNKNKALRKNGMHRSDVYNIINGKVLNTAYRYRQTQGLIKTLAELDKLTLKPTTK